MSKVYIGDTGTQIILNCGQDVSAATVRSIEVRKPNKAVVSLLAQASGTNSISYTSLAGTFDVPGRWLLQAKITLPSGVWRGETAILEVYAKFD